MSRIATRQRRTIWYDETGAGPAVLLLAGRGWARTSWRPLVTTLAPFFRVITMDNRDAGESDPEPVPYTMAELGQDAADFLTALRIKQARIIGHSMGAMIALHLALDAPALVNRLVLIAATAGGWSPRVLDFYRQPPEHWTADPVARMRAAYAELSAPGWAERHPAEIAALANLAQGNRLTLEGYMRQQGAIASHDLTAHLSEIAAPTLVIHGEQDTLIPPKRAQVLADGLPNACLRLLPEVAHLPQLEAADEVNAAILDFLEGGIQSGE
ncbi:MAG TPA: alpha/beta fold hydrolase [Thermomicrobiales bacterium]|nr:alpha/beta fold hydrolase [Thermomicrobiales bacterium]